MSLWGSLLFEILFLNNAWIICLDRTVLLVLIRCERMHLIRNTFIGRKRKEDLIEALPVGLHNGFSLVSLLVD